MRISIANLPFGVASGFLSSPEISFTFSQEGEDIVLLELLGERSGSPGFYVDIGAHHPRRFSNTYIFYLQNWSGINVDPTPGSMAAFRQERGRDINLEIGVDETEGSRRLYLFNDPALNTFDPERARFLETTTPYRVVGQHELPVRRLTSILDEHVPAGQALDFLNVDVEGLDLAVIRSSDWARYRPRVVVLEDHEFDLLGTTRTPSLSFMLEVGYRPVARLPRSVFYVDAR
jgi:FkbM family methyltransferase